MNILSFFYTAKLLISENFYVKSVGNLSLPRAEFNAHIFSCNTTFISFHSWNTPECATPGGGTSSKGIAEHGHIKKQFQWWPQTELRVCHGHKDFLSGHESNESVCRRYCLPHRDANSVALWKLMFYIYCSHPMEANQPQPELMKSKGCKMSHFHKMSHFLIPLQPNFGIFRLFLWVVWQPWCCQAVMRDNCPKAGELRSHRAAAATLSAQNKGPVSLLLQKMTEKPQE